MKIFGVWAGEINEARRSEVPRVDDFVNALKIAQASLAERDPAELCGNAGGELLSLPEGTVIRLPFFRRLVEITYPEGRVTYAESTEAPSLQEQGLILHYLLGACDLPPTKELITFREIPSGEFYYQPFVNRAQIPLVNTFGSDLVLFRTAGLKAGGTEAGMGDASLTFHPLPKVPVTLVLWQGDEEFPSTSNILFDGNIKHYLDGEDIAFLAGIVVYKLMAQAAHDR